jgi:hypothetical protein
MSKELENIRASLQLKSDLDASGRKHFDDAIDILKKMPAHRITACLQYLEKNLMPAVERKGGKASPDLQVFKECAELLKWAVVVYDRLEFQVQNNGLLRLEKQLLIERVLLAERELQKYETMEDLSLTSLRDHIEKGVRARIESDLKGKKSGFRL